MTNNNFKLIIEIDYPYIIISHQTYSAIMNPETDMPISIVPGLPFMWAKISIQDNPITFLTKTLNHIKFYIEEELKNEKYK